MSNIVSKKKKNQQKSQNIHKEINSNDNNGPFT